jgi:membrane-associated phospholipid phosphatase
VEFPAVKKPFFSENPKYEQFWLEILLAVAAVSAVILILAWPQTRSIEIIAMLQQWRSAPVEVLFRVFTFIGDDQFFMIFFSIIIWCFSKTFGYWGAFMLLSSATFSNLIKDVTLLERPPIEGITHPPGSYAFPSGHTLTAVTVWPYLAVRLKYKVFWIWSVVAVVMIGFSRMVLGYHFLGDILGGLALGIPFLLLFLWLSSLIYEKGWLEKFSMLLLLVVSVAIPVLLLAVLPGTDPPKILGYLAGASVGYIVEKEKIRSVVKAPIFLQVIKVLIGLAVLFGIIIGLGSLLPSAVKALGFIRYALGGVWVTLGAPLIFTALSLAGKEKQN